MNIFSNETLPAIGTKVQLVQDLRNIGGSSFAPQCKGVIERYTRTQCLIRNEHGNLCRVYLLTGLSVGSDRLTPSFVALDRTVQAVARTVAHVQASKPAPAPLAMLRHHVSGAIARGESEAITEQRETFAEYLARVGRDQLESGREFTAQDYAQASARIAALMTRMESVADSLEYFAREVPPSRSECGTMASGLRRVLADNFQHLTA